MAQVEVKRALSREEQQNSVRSGNLNCDRGAVGEGDFKTKKIFVGGLPSTITEDGFRQYFESYGTVTDVVVMYDQNTQRPRGFGFITFETEDAVDRVLHKTFHDLNGKLVEVKRALPKEANPGGGGRGGSHQGYGSSGASTNTSDVRMDGNRYAQQQMAASGFPPYAGYGTPGYGYGAASGMAGYGTGGYGGYGSYGAGGYGTAGTGYGGPTGAYGNLSAAHASYARGQHVSMKTTWASQNSSGYGPNAASGPMSQSPGGTSSYGNQAFAYNNYVGSDGRYSGGYGATGTGNFPGSGSVGGAGGGEQQGSVGGYSGTNGNLGYTNAAWRPDPLQASGGYGGGYGGQA